MTKTSIVRLTMASLLSAVFALAHAQSAGANGGSTNNNDGGPAVTTDSGTAGMSKPRATHKHKRRHHHHHAHASSTSHEATGMPNTSEPTSAGLPGQDFNRNRGDGTNAGSMGTTGSDTSGTGTSGTGTSGSGTPNLGGSGSMGSGSGSTGSGSGTSGSTTGGTGR